ncbi:hypothetical protein C0431_12950 [bacterium]|nr:hypothetical protein [bacterium]
MLGACGSEEPKKVDDDLGFGNEVIFYTDPANGCEYLIFDGNKAGNIIPRMDPDGTQMCDSE